MPSSKPCKVCGCTESKLIDGYFYCKECGTQDVDMQETIIGATEREHERGEYNFGRATKIRKKKVEIEMSEDWKIWHAFNFIVANMADEVVALGAKSSFKVKLLWIWSKYIKKFHKKDYNEIKQTNTIFGSDNEDSDIENEEEYEPGIKSSMNAEVQASNISIMSMHVVYALLYVALNLDNSDIQLSDLLRWKREGRLSFAEAVKYVPEDLDVWSIQAWKDFLKSSQKEGLISIVHIRLKSIGLFICLKLGTSCVPDLTAITKRYCKELCLPKEFRALTLSLLDLLMARASELLTVFHRILPNYETIVMACIVIGLKLCFGLDDDYDLKLSFYVDEINSEQQHPRAFRIGASGLPGRLFNFREWLQYLEYRKHILAKYYYPMAYLHQIGLKEPIGSEALKDHSTLRKPNSFKTRQKIDKISLQLLKTLPVHDYKVIPREEFVVSLTPLTSYTVFLVQRITDAEERLILTEDFSKYSLKYACEDLCLRSSEVDDNIIKGISEDNKNILNTVDEKFNFKYPLIPPGIFVIDYEYEDWAKDYRQAEMKGTEETKVIEEDLKPVANIIEELDEKEDIFSNYDAKYDAASILSSNETKDNPADFSMDNNSMADYGNTFEEMNNTSATAFQHFDPLYFNREEMIRKLVLDACYDFKMPVPHEYRNNTGLAPRTRKTTDEARVRNQNRYQMSAIDILKTYKSLIPEEHPSPVVNREDDDPLMEAIFNNMAANDVTDLNNAGVSDEGNLGADDNEQFNDTHDTERDEESMQVELETQDEPDQNVDLPNSNLDDNNRNTDDPTKDLDIEQFDIGMNNKEIIDHVNALLDKKKRLYGEIMPEQDAQVLAKKARVFRTRESYEKLIKDNVNLNEFKYYLKFNSMHSEHLMNEKMLMDMPNSLRVVLENCGSIIEYPIFILFNMLKQVEQVIFCNCIATKRTEINNLLLDLNEEGKDVELNATKNDLQDLFEDIDLMATLQ